ncbi:hypothetical protein Angca_001727, partial [Angiostrongylus cantonensis]
EVSRHSFASNLSGEISSYDLKECMLYSVEPFQPDIERFKFVFVIAWRQLADDQD